MILSSLPLAGMMLLRKRDVVFISSDNLKKRKRLLAKWKCEDLILIFVAGLYTTACFVFTMSFCANVTTQDHWNYLVSCVTSLFQNLILTPFVIATFLAVIVTIVSKNHDLIHKAQKRIGVFEELDPDQEKQQQAPSAIFMGEQGQEKGQQTVQDSLDNRVPASRRVEGAINAQQINPSFPDLNQAMFRVAGFTLQDINVSKFTNPTPILLRPSLTKLKMSTSGCKASPKLPACADVSVPSSEYRRSLRGLMISLLDCKSSKHAQIGPKSVENQQEHSFFLHTWTPISYFQTLSGVPFEPPEDFVYLGGSGTSGTRR